MSRPSRPDRIAAFDDPRRCGKVVSALPATMLRVPCGPPAGAEDSVEVRHRGRWKPGSRLGPLPFAEGIPSHDTIDQVMDAPGGALFPGALAARVEGLRTGKGRTSASTIKHMAMNPHRVAPGREGLRVRRRAAAWDRNALTTIIAGTGR